MAIVCNFALDNNNSRKQNGNNSRLRDGVAETAGRTGTAHLWHAHDERCAAEDGRSATATHPGKDDHEPTDGHADGNVCDLRRAVIVGDNGNDRIVRVGRTADAGAGHLGDYGGEYRHYAHGVDYVAGI